MQALISVHTMFKLKYLIVVSLLWLCCKSTSEFTGFSYDPPGVTNTTDKIIEPQKRRVIGAGQPKVWISNEFESARFNDFYQLDDKKFEVLIKPENAPINNSPWYSFRVWSDSVQSIELTLKYDSARHRYKPKIWYRDSISVVKQVIEQTEYDSASGSVSFELKTGPEPQHISAHFPDHILFSDLQNRLSDLPQSFIEVDTAGWSVQNRPVYQVTVDETSVQRKGVLILISRQHPPETSGYRVYQSFFDEIISESQLAHSFRQHFVVEAFPILNPDGVVNGHWRHNAAGIDLNRDWKNFNQPETKAVKNALTPLTENDQSTVYYGIDFHSTNENIFYPINEEVVTFPDNFTQRWTQVVDEENPEYNFRTEEFDTSSPISKNWIYNTFGADAITFEVHDELTLEESAKLGKSAARSLMKMLIEEWNHSGKK
jgi:hypothetical protein